MNKTNVLKELKIWNNTKEVCGFKIRRQAWEDNQWQIVDSLDFEKAKIIRAFFYQKELADYIFKNQKD